MLDIFKGGGALALRGGGGVCRLGGGRNATVERWSVNYVFVEGGRMKRKNKRGGGSPSRIKIRERRVTSQIVGPFLRSEELAKGVGLSRKKAMLKGGT